MKIGIITNLYPPYARGGAENIIVRTVGQLLTMGHDVFVITGQPKPLGQEIILDRSSTERVYRFFPRNLYFTLDDYKWPALLRGFWHVIDAFGWSSASRVRKILVTERPDVVITHNLKGIGLNIPRAIRAENIPHVHVIHDLQLLYPSGLLLAGEETIPGWKRWPYELYKDYCRLRIGNPDLVLSPSEYLKAAYLAAGFFAHTQVRVLRNPLPANVIPRSVVRASGPLTLFYVGQLAAHKGIELFLRVFASLTQDKRLLIVGDGPLRPQVEAAASADKRVRYLGFMPPEELSKFFAVVDAVVVPSLCYENSPTVIYEALSAGVPVIASRIGGVGELVQDGVTGYLFKPGDEQDFFRCLNEFDANKYRLIAAGDSLRASVADYALDKYTQRLTEILESVVAKHEMHARNKRA